MSSATCQLLGWGDGCAALGTVIEGLGGSSVILLPDTDCSSTSKTSPPSLDGSGAVNVEISMAFMLAVCLFVFS